MWRSAPNFHCLLVTRHSTVVHTTNNSARTNIHFSTPVVVWVSNIRQLASLGPTARKVCENLGKEVILKEGQCAGRMSRTAWAVCTKLKAEVCETFAWKVGKLRARWSHSSVFVDKYYILYFWKNMLANFPTQRTWGVASWKLGKHEWCLPRLVKNWGAAAPPASLSPVSLSQPESKDSFNLSL